MPLDGPDGATAELTLSDFWFQGGRVILRFAGYDTVEKAESLRNFEICVPESEVVELDEGEIYDWQLQVRGHPQA